MQIGLGLSMRGPKGLTVVQQAINILRKYGTDAHVYLPGVGVLNGLTAGNYIDSAGTTAGVVDNPVGLVLDAAGGLGVELAGTLSSNAGWSQGVMSGDNLSITNATGAITYPQTALLTGASGISQVSVTVVSQTSVVSIANQGGTVIKPLSVGVNVFNLPKGSDNKLLLIMPATTTIVVSAFSVREVTGIAASQALTGAKPRLERGLRNLLTWNGDFTNAAWLAVGSASKTSASTFNFAANSASAVEQAPIISGGTASKTFTVAALVSCASGSVPFRLKNTHGAVLDNFSAELLATTTPQLFTFTVTNGAGVGSGAQNFGIVNSAVTPIFNTIISGGAALFQGTLTAAQIQTNGGIPLTTTVAASNPDAGRFSWAFDGGDSLALGSVPFQMSDDHWVVAVAKPESTASDGLVFSIRAASATPIVGQLGFTPTGQPDAVWRDDAGVLCRPQGGASRLGQVVVLSLRKTGANKILRVNGTQPDATNTTPLGVATVTGAALGCNGFSPAGGNFFTGSNYVTICGKGTISDADLLTIERAFGALNGVSI